MSVEETTKSQTLPAGKRPQAVATREQAQRQRYVAGDILFNQGDPGGDLLFIEDGCVEIYQDHGGQTLVLSEMQAGEIIGVLTCMTTENRMASARAKTDVLCKRIPQYAIGKFLQTLPNWMKIVLKEFTIRLTQMNRLYGEANAKIRDLEQQQITPVYLASLIASAFAGTAELVAVSTEAGKIVMIDDVLQRLEGILNMKREDIDRIWSTMLQSNLVKIEIDPEKKREMTRLDNARKLTFFAQFVRDSRHGAAKRLLNARFSNKETRVLSGLVKYAQHLAMDLTKVCKLPMKDLESALERKTGIRWDVEAIQKGLALKLLALEGHEDQQLVVFRPSEMGRTVACVDAMRRLKEIDLSTPAQEEHSKGKKTAA